MHRETQPTSTDPAESKGEPLAGLSDEDLVLRAQADPSSADACVALLFERYGDKVRTWCRRLCRDPTLAEDAAQEVFIKLHQRLDTFRGGSRFTTWLFVLSRNHTLDFLAARRNQASGDSFEDLPAEPADPRTFSEDSLATHDLRDRLRQAIGTVLEPEEARVVILHCLHGLTLPVVTEMMGLQNRSGAKALFVAAKRRLRAHFSKELMELGQTSGGAPDG